ncbi:g-protein coupled receptor [Ophiostoma piceae UAMH 11346]|uniref:G-protein coupled receptor n=1 Tax=Ophiostoma piceae (strain UAMH 11346) TaxID=1262450 RepID=S3CSR1_OPHP1|nr:g-protein coupled receptor [Ophiostoma piceae UAMH 11346]
MDADDLTQHQLDGFNVVERVASVLSLLGCIVIITTFCASKSFHKPINRLVFYASFGNLMTNVATLMARTYLGNDQSPGCQFQAFLIQMFMPADALWTLAMAINVYLTFYYKYDARRLRRMELLYLGCCYGIPFIVALVFVFVRTPTRGRMYGNATLWCWVSPEWDIFRIATFYGPVWAVILVTFFIYIRAGSEIYKKHRQLRDFKYSYSHHEPEPLQTMDDMHGAKTTQVYVTTEINTAHHTEHGGDHDQSNGESIDLSPLGRRDPSGTSASAAKDTTAVYTVHISASNNRNSYNDVDLQLPIQSPALNHSQDQSQNQNQNQDSHSFPSLEPQRTHASTANASALAPVATTVSNVQGPRNPATQRLRRKAAYEANSAAWSYTKCALLFFTAMLVTWIPSSANRVFSVVHIDKISLPLEYMSAFVLPLQGFWNAIIYVVTSWKACRTLWDDVRHRSGGGTPHANSYPLTTNNNSTNANANTNTNSAPSNDSDDMMDRMMMGGRGASSKSEKSYESESVRELAIR